MTPPPRPQPGFFAVGRTFGDAHGVLERVWASASGREARTYRTDESGILLVIDGHPVERGPSIENVFFSPDGRRALHVRFDGPHQTELVENEAVVCRGSYIRVWFSPDGAHWALRWCDPEQLEIVQLDGVEVFRTPWDRYMGGSGWSPPWEETPGDP